MPPLKFLVINFAMVIILFGQSAIASALTPTETVKDTIATVINILNDPIY